MPRKNPAKTKVENNDFDFEMPKKKVLMAITKGNWGGAQRYVFDLATNIPKNSFEVVVAYGQGNNLEEKLSRKGIRTIRVSNLGRDIKIFCDLSTFFSLLKIIRKEKPDILHLNSSKIGGIGALAGRITGVKNIVFTGHGWAWNEDRNWLSKALITLAHWLTILMSHKVIAVSGKIASEIKRLPLVNNSKIIVIHNGISSIEYEERFAARALLGDKVSEKFWVGAIAELHKNKGLDTLIEAFGKISDRHSDTALVIVGEGEERKKLASQIEKLSLSKKAVLLGFVDDAGRLLKAFDILVLPSRTEAFPYVPLEAGLAQLPLIATKVGGVPELISDNKNGLLIEPGDSDELAEKIDELLENSTKATVLGHNLRKTVEKDFSTSSMVEKTLSVYN